MLIGSHEYYMHVQCNPCVSTYLHVWPIRPMHAIRRCSSNCICNAMLCITCSTITGVEGSWEWDHTMGGGMTATSPYEYPYKYIHIWYNNVVHAICLPEAVNEITTDATPPRGYCTKRMLRLLVASQAPLVLLQLVLLISAQPMLMSTYIDGAEFYAGRHEVTKAQWDLTFWDFYQPINHCC